MFPKQQGGNIYSFWAPVSIIRIARDATFCPVVIGGFAGMTAVGAVREPPLQDRQVGAMVFVADRPLRLFEASVPVLPSVVVLCQDRHGGLSLR